MLYNNTTNKAVCKKVREADTMLSRGLGLMLKRKKSVDYCLAFSFPKPTRIGASTHTMFMLFPIDIVYLDEEKRVVEIKNNVRPWRLQKPSQKIKHFIEFRKGESKGIKKGDKLSF